MKRLIICAVLLCAVQQTHGFIISRGGGGGLSTLPALFQGLPKETAPQGDTRVITARGGTVRQMAYSSMGGVALQNYTGGKIGLTVKRTGTITTGSDTEIATTNVLVNSGYVLPTASATTKGGFKVGPNLSIDGDGVLTANIGVPPNGAGVEVRYPDPSPPADGQVWINYSSSKLKYRNGNKIFAAAFTQESEISGTCVTQSEYVVYAPTHDSTWEVYDSNNTDNMAQSFTMAAGKDIYSVSIYAKSKTGNTETTRIVVNNALGIETPLGYKDLLLNSTLEWKEFIFDTPITVASGQYYFQIQKFENSYDHSTVSAFLASGQYSGGAYWLSSTGPDGASFAEQAGSDLLFKVKTCD